MKGGCSQDWPPYRALASSSANALCGPPAARLAPAALRLPRLGGRWSATGAAATGGELWLETGAVTAGCCALGGWYAGLSGRCSGPRSGRSPGRAAPFGLGGCAGFARSRRSSRGARSKRRIMEFISSVFGASMNANPLDSCVSGLRITLIASATRFSAVSQPLISSAVTQTGKLPKKTVKLIRRLSSTPLVGVCGSRSMVPRALPAYHTMQKG